MASCVAAVRSRMPCSPLCSRSLVRVSAMRYRAPMPMPRSLQSCSPRSLRQSSTGVLATLHRLRLKPSPQPSLKRRRRPQTPMFPTAIPPVADPPAADPPAVEPAAAEAAEAEATAEKLRQKGGGGMGGVAPDRGRPGGLAPRLDGHVGAAPRRPGLCQEPLQGGASPRARD